MMSEIKLYTRNKKNEKMKLFKIQKRMLFKREWSPLSIRFVEKSRNGFLSVESFQYKQFLLEKYNAYMLFNILVKLFSEIEVRLK